MIGLCGVVCLLCGRGKPPSVVLISLGKSLSVMLWPLACRKGQQCFCWEFQGQTEALSVGVDFSVGEKGIEEWPVKAGMGLRALCALKGLPRSHCRHGAGNILGAHWRDELCWLLWGRPCSAFFLLCKEELLSTHAHSCALEHCHGHMHLCTTCSPPCPAWLARTRLLPTECPHSCFWWADFSFIPLLQAKSQSTADLGLAKLISLPNLTAFSLGRKGSLAAMQMSPELPQGRRVHEASMDAVQDGTLPGMLHSNAP